MPPQNYGLCVCVCHPKISHIPQAWLKLRTEKDWPKPTFYLTDEKPETHSWEICSGHTIAICSVVLEAPPLFKLHTPS